MKILDTNLWVFGTLRTNTQAVETTVSDRGMVTIPAALRRRLDIEPGDKLRWEADDGELTVEVVDTGVFIPA